MKLQVLNSSGKVIRENDRVPKEKGLNRIEWDLREEGARQRRPPSEDEIAFFGGPRGPQVLPGTYTVKLTVGSKTQEKRVEVRLDPTITVAPADLQTQYDHALKLRDMQSSMTDAIRSLDSVKAQLEQIEKTVKDRMPDAPAELTKAIDDYKKQVDTLLGSIARPADAPGFGGGARLSEKIGGLFFTVEGVNAAPTPSQREYFGELQAEFPKKVDEVNKFLTQTVPQMNETLRRHNAPTLVAGKPVDMPR